jgi:transketolase N-terminal domain/subunit
MSQFCQEHDIQLLTYGTVGGGLLSERFLRQPEPTRSMLNTVSLRKYKQMVDAWGGWGLFQELLSALKRIADNIRVLAASMPEKAKSGHPGGPMGGADFMALVYAEFLNFDPNDMTWAHRDRFFQDAGHLSAMMYGTLSLFGKYSMEELAAFRQWESPTPGHPERDVARGIENTSGPLGQGHVMACGAAVAERVLSNRFGGWLDHKTVAYISDGGVQEEASQGVGRIAGHLGLSNLIMFYDSNDVQLSHMTKDTMSEDTAKKYEAWGWAVETVDGHDFDQMRAALKRAWARTDRPTFIVGRTVMGKGAVRADGSSYEGSPKLHGNPLSKSEASFEKTIESLGGDPANPFVMRFLGPVTEIDGQLVRPHDVELSTDPEPGAVPATGVLADTVAIDFEYISVGKSVFIEQDVADAIHIGEVIRTSESVTDVKDRKVRARATNIA